MHDDTIDNPADLDYAASREARRLARGEQSPAQHRAAAIELLRDLVDDPTAKSQDRRQAASDLLKANDVLDESDATKAVRQLTDTELLVVIEEARVRRSIAAGELVSRGTSGVASRLALTAGFDAHPDVVYPGPAEPAEDFEFNLDDIPDRPELTYADLM